MNKILNKKKIILVIGGGISAYKSLELIRLLKKQECEVKVVLTESGKKFVTPLSIVSLSKNKIYTDIFDSENEAEMDHISLSRWCDIILFAPITANSLAKLAYGKADDLASTLILASNKQVIFAPAMNIRMWIHKATQSNFNKSNYLISDKIKDMEINQLIVKDIKKTKGWSILEKCCLHIWKTKIIKFV